MGEPERHSQGHGRAPAWAVIITYLACWAAGGFLLATTEQGDWPRLVAGIFLIIWPLTGASPGEIIRAWRGQP
jgi:hypothetical protein